MESGLVEILRLCIYFFIYSIFGWILESVYKSITEKKYINSGFLNGPLCPIYGTGGAIMILFLSSFKNNIFLLFIIGFIVLSIWEYFVGWLLETLFNAKYWDYTNRKFNVKGRICLANSVIWGLLAVIFIGFVHPVIEKLIIKIPENPLLYINIILIIPFIIDSIISIIKVASINSALDKFKEIGESLKDKLEELKNLNTIKDSTQIKGTTFEKIAGVKEELGEKIAGVKDGIEDKIKGIESAIEDLKLKQNVINIEFYNKIKNLKNAFPTMKSEKLSIFFDQKVDEKKLKQQKLDNKKKSYKSDKKIG